MNKTSLLAAAAAICALAISASPHAAVRVTELRCNRAPDDVTGKLPKWDESHNCKYGYTVMSDTDVTVNTAASTVLLEGSGGRLFLQNCKLADDDNWECKQEGGPFPQQSPIVWTYGMSHGTYYSSLTDDISENYYYSSMTGASGVLCRLGLHAKCGLGEWLPFATNSQGEQSWLTWWNMAPPTQFQTHADCMARVGQFLSSDYNSKEFKASYGCMFHGNSYYLVYLMNWLYDGGSFAGCLSKRTTSSAGSSRSDPLYDAALIGKAEAEPTWHCAGWWTDPGLLRSQAQARHVAACQNHNSGWEHVAAFDVAEHIARFNERCAALDVKTNCRLVRDPPVPAPPNETEGKRAYRELMNELSTRQECSDQHADVDGRAAPPLPPIADADQGRGPGSVGSTSRRLDDKACDLRKPACRPVAAVPSKSR